MQDLLKNGLGGLTCEELRYNWTEKKLSHRVLGSQTLTILWRALDLAAVSELFRIETKELELVSLHQSVTVFRLNAVQGNNFI